eukprot:356164-Chlamydomonas_euryale.AAC.1
MARRSEGSADGKAERGQRGWQGGARAARITREERIARIAREETACLRFGREETLPPLLSFRRSARSGDGGRVAERQFPPHTSGRVRVQV